jgi:carbonic anhydrase
MVAGLAVCPLCADRGSAAETTHPHWSYKGASGPTYWAKLDHASAACGAGAQQSPLNLEHELGATLPPLEIDWRGAGGVVVNNGHTIQVNMPSNGTLRAGDASYTLTP